MHHASRLFLFLELARWHSAAGAALAVWVGGRLAGAGWEPRWLLPMAVAFLLSAAGNAYNDVGDVKADRLNRPSRPIPRGVLTVAQARGFAFACALMALLIAHFLGPLAIAGAALALLLLLSYTPHLKRLPLLGNAVVGLLTGMCVAFGGLVAGDVLPALLPAFALGLLFGGREILKTLYDLDGDRAVGAVTTATRWGTGAAARLAALCFAVALAALALWALADPARWPVPLATLLLVVTTLVPLWRRRSDRPSVGRALIWSKVSGLTLLLLFALL